MGYPTKIATCCYCGTRAALVLGRDRHELSCSSCGAPLHDMKRLRQDKRSPKSDRIAANEGRVSYEKPKKYKKHGERAPYKRRKKRKSLVRHIMEEAFDVLEDIFD